MLQDRILVAHNAQFDYDFLAYEFARARMWLPVSRRCAYRNPGRLTPGGPLQQGMKIAITGETAHARAELVGRAVAAGLNKMTSVSRHTSVLATNEPVSDSAKARRAIAEGVPVIDEHTFLRLLAEVRTGTAHEAETTAASPVIASVAPPATARVQVTESPSTTAPVPDVPVPPPPSPDVSVDVSVPAPRQPGDWVGILDKPLTGHRVLVLGGIQAVAAAARTRVELGGGPVWRLRTVGQESQCPDGPPGVRSLGRVVERGGGAAQQSEAAGQQPRAGAQGEDGARWSGQG